MKVLTFMNPSFQKNLISKSLVQQLGLETHAHPQAYPLDWLIKETNTGAIKKYNFRVATTSNYINEIECDIVPLVINLVQRML
jgi:hypothetical protein